MTQPALTPAQAEALDDLYHNADLIGRQPLACEIEWALERAYKGESREAAHAP